MNYLSLCLAATAALGIATSFATAADYDPPIFIDQVDEVRPVEIGSGWYLRGDVGYNINRPYDDSTFAATPFSTFSDDEQPIFGSVGMGYHWNDLIRTELNIGYLSEMEQTAGQSSFNPDGSLFSTERARADNEMFFGMAGAMVDLGTFVGFTPYLGAGIGGVYVNRHSDVGVTFDDPALFDTRTTSRERDYSLAYTLNAGVSYAATKNLSVDFGYQYFSAPDVQYTRLTGPSSAETAKGLDFHQVKVGLRYDLW